MITTRVYVSGDVVDDPGCIKKDGLNPCLAGIFFSSFNRSVDNYHFQLEDDCAIIPESIMPYVTRFSILESIPDKWHRTSGIYKFRSAMATIDRPPNRITDIKVVGTKIDDVRKLYRLIRAGKILPIESWETDQITKEDVLKKMKESFQKLTFFQKAKKLLDGLYGKLSRK